jgi:mannose-6-phosphate isomerase
MEASPLYPLRFEPLFQYRLWGGRRLGEWLNRPLPGEEPIGEAWVLSDRDDHASKVSEGPLEGATLTELMKQRADELLGEQAEGRERFPLLLKFLDVRQMLSVQVHPRDDQHGLIPKGDTGKSEAWVVLEADADARIYAGLKPRTTEADLRGLTTQSADEHLACFHPKPGQAVMIEAGTVHSLGDGLMVFEVQENSDVTFRLYDWDHVDAKTGRKRDLQVDQALACIDLDQGPVKPVTPAVEHTAPAPREALFDDPHFRLWRQRGEAPFAVGAEGQARVLVCTEGKGAIDHAGKAFGLERGGVMLLPACLGACEFRPDGAAALLEIAIPDRS